MLTTRPPTPQTFARLRLFACITSVAIALAVLFGWATHNHGLARLFAPSNAVNPMTCLGLLAISWAMVLRTPRTAPSFYALSTAALVIGATKLLQLALGNPGGIDQLLFADQLGSTAGVPHNQMAPNTAFALVILGVGLLTSRSRDPRAVIFSQLICLIAAAIGAAALVGYLLDVVALYQVHQYFSMALPTAVAMVLLSVAIISLNPEVGVMRIFSDSGPAGSLARIALPIALLVPIVVNMLGLSGERAGYYGNEAAVAIALITNVLLNFVLFGGWTVALHRSDSERQQRDAAIVRSEQHYRQAEGVAHIGYWRVEFPSKAIQWSDGFLEICGLPKDTPPSLETAVGIYHHDDALLARMALAQAQEGCSDWEFSCRVHRPDGQIRHVKSRGVCERNADGKTTEIFGVILDVTALEIARREAEAAKATTATFLANMSHEIRTPMNGVMGFVELLLDSNLDKTQRRHLNLIQESAQALLKLLNDILDISKIEAGRLEINPVPFNIRHGIEQCVRLMVPIAEQKGIGLSVDFEKDFPAHLIIDGLRTRQILLNLLGNAIKFTNRGSVSVAVTRGISGDGLNTIRVCVTDTGTGIRADRITAVFDNFVQEELTTTRCFGGTGLGLSISLQLAEMMDGAIEVDSVVNQGTRMTIVLPLVESSALPEEDDPTLTPEPAAAVRRIKPRYQASVLVVEDVEINQELFIQMLTRLGHRVDTASDGAEAVELAKRLLTEPNAWDLILMDLQMPVMGGLAATRAIRALGGRAATIPIIALTASAFEDDRQACEDAGMNDHVAKPVGFEPLRLAVGRWTYAAASLESDAIPKPVWNASLCARFEARRLTSAERLSQIAEELSGATPGAMKTLLAEAQEIAHMLAGTAGMFGEEALGNLASSAEAKIVAAIDAKGVAARTLAGTAIAGLANALTGEEADSYGAAQAREA
jgi:signal transduction histidine kinase/CheY-like chemotaxis protein/HPt (histidine-containing phosphotransfer) domain-containing protein